MDETRRMLRLDNDHVKNLDKPTEYQEFHASYVDQMVRARNSIFIEMCNEIGLGYDYRFIGARYIKAKRTITKEKLGDWTETLAHILDTYCVPWLQKAAPLAEEVRTLRSEVQKLTAENSAYQKRVIDLQTQLIDKQNEQLNSVKSMVETEMKTYSASVKSTVETEMKSYSEAVSKSCSNAFAPKKIQAAVQKASEKEERNHNVIIYGLEEKNNENLRSNVEEVLSEIGEKPRIQDCCRVGLKKEGSSRPIKFSLSSAAHVIQILRNARKLRSKNGFGSIYVCPDRSLEERKAYKKLVEEVKMKRDSEPDKAHFIRRNKVVSAPFKNSQPP